MSNGVAHRKDTELYCEISNLFMVAIVALITN